MKNIKIVTAVLLLMGSTVAADAMTHDTCNIGGGSWAFIRGWGWGCIFGAVVAANRRGKVRI